MCAANYCRADAKHRVEKAGVVLLLCDRHVGTYLRMGYAYVHEKARP
jgi:hypothetical protein